MGDAGRKDDTADDAEVGDDGVGGRVKGVSSARSNPPTIGAWGVMGAIDEGEEVGVCWNV